MLNIGQRWFLFVGCLAISYMVVIKIGRAVDRNSADSGWIIPIDHEILHSLEFASFDPSLALAPFEDSSRESLAALPDTHPPPPPHPPPSSIPKGNENYYWPTPKRMALSHVQGSGQGIGFGTDYSTAALLLAPDYRLGHILPMIDARVHRFDNNTYAANLGIAGRYLPEDNTFCEMLGFNLFYDYRQGLKTSHHYNQIGVGIEVLGKRWDFRANCYYPIGRNQHKSTCVFDDFEGGFFMIHRKCEGVSYGYNAEIGYQITKEQPFLLYAAAGPYYLARKCHDKTLGGKARLRPQYKDYLALDLSVSYDPVFKAVYQAEIIVSIPLYQMRSKKDRHGPCNMSDRKVYQPIIRFEVSPLGKKSCWHTNF